MAGDGGTGRDASVEPAPEPAGPAAGKRPLVERLGMAGIAIVLGALFAIVAAAGLSGGEYFLAGMGAIGALMTLWVGAITLFRG